MHRLRLPARRRHLHALRAERAPDRQECRAVGDVPGLDGAPRCSSPSTPTSTPSSRPSSESAPPRSAPLNQIGGVVADIGERDAEAADRGGRAPVRDRRLEGLRQAADQARPRRRRGAGRDREVLRAARWRSGAAASPSSRSASPAPSAARRRCSGGATSWKPSCSASSPASARCEAETGQGARRPTTRPRQEIAAKRIEALAEDGGVEGTLKRGKGPDLSPAHGRAGRAAAQALDHGRPALKRGAAPARPGVRPHRQPQARDRHHQRRCRQVQGRDPDRRAAHQGGRKPPSGDAEGTQDRSGPRAAGLRARARRLPPAARHRAAGRPADRSAAICSTPC